MFLKQTFILFFVWQNVLPMMRKSKQFLCDLNEFDKKSDSGTSAERAQNRRGEGGGGEVWTKNAPKAQKMSRGPGNEHILQWFHRCQMPQQRQIPQKAEEEEEEEEAIWRHPFEFVKMHFKDSENVILLDIDVHVEEEEEQGEEAEAIVQICLCDEEKELCDGPYEAKENFGGKIDPKVLQCVKFDYQSAFKKEAKYYNKFLIKAIFALNYNLMKQHRRKEKKQEQEKVANKETKSPFFGIFKRHKSQNALNQLSERKRHNGNLLPKFEERRERLLDREFFLRISFESRTMSKVSRVWAVHKCLKFDLLPSTLDKL